MKIEIKSWLNGSILFEGDFSCIADAVKVAIKSSANLSYANLRYANLSYSDLSSANLSYSDLSYSDLISANLRYADLRYANLSSANLRYANLSYAKLSYSDLSSAKLSYANLSYANLSYADLSYGKIKSTSRPFIQISPLGADARQLMAFNTENGICLITGCFTGGVKEFKAALKAKHGNNHIAKEYLLAVNLIENHFKLWK